MSRLKASTPLSGTILNLFLMEYTPSNRVLSGEIIVFQNEMIDIFKLMVQEQTLKRIYVSGVMVEFFRALVEHQIPQQNVL